MGCIDMTAMAKSLEGPKQYIKCFHQHVPVYSGEEAKLDADRKLLAAARKAENKLLDRCELEFTDPKKGPKARYNYLSSLRCLQAKMLEVNGCRELRQRLSLRQIIEASEKYHILLKLDEPVRLSRIPKSSGVGWRTIQSFGPVARGAQGMIVALLGMAYSPAPFQFTRPGVHAAIQEALRLITEEGYSWVSELDITGHYQAFTMQSLMSTLPLPKGAIREIVMASSANRDASAIPPVYRENILHQASLGIPQGSAASTVVAEWSVSHLNLITAEDVALINYADNMFLFGKSAEALASALEALRAAIAALPGGAFLTHHGKAQHGVIQPIEAGFRMLGCEITQTKTGINVEPTKESLQEFEGFFWIQSQAIAAELFAAKQLKDQVLRLQGIQSFLRLRSYANGWLAAHAVCTDIPMIKGDVRYKIDALAHTFQFTPTELKAAADASTKIKYYPTSQVAAY
ncbi:reverse transcriptase domain-containing protein [Roseibacterium sp. SDUM158017]|uniref:reverse transcriptase domain-containing protein n=1 Tax=Roseicyclus salinarum TaxID=3036773 RepID=UPI0024152E11|nr:reverse transcriptase domain-containing protein [Roseibacterium sp. SDUM158017]MDG4650439.1 reverse transcriptase domain-containing protein [Roseibacterium sp. SDUM158017]